MASARRPELRARKSCRQRKVKHTHDKDADASQENEQDHGDHPQSSGHMDVTDPDPFESVLPDANGNDRSPEDFEPNSQRLGSAASRYETLNCDFHRGLYLIHQDREELGERAAQAEWGMNMAKEEVKRLEEQLKNINRDLERATKENEERDIALSNQTREMDEELARAHQENMDLRNLLQEFCSNPRVKRLGFS